MFHFSQGAFKIFAFRKILVGGHRPVATLKAGVTTRLRKFEMHPFSIPTTNKYLFHSVQMLDKLRFAESD